MRMAAVGARANPAATAAAASYYCHPRAGVFPDMAYPQHQCDGSGFASSYDDGASPAASGSFPPAPGVFATGLGLEQQLDVFECLSDEAGVPAPVVPGTFGTAPAPVSVERVVPDAATGHGHARIAAAVAVGEGARRTGRIAFRTRSEEEVLDDGYKWRKYGKKSVKNSPNPRNYYRCSTEGCDVKKRVERDRDDPNYVVTMYEGVHNHVSPGTIYYASQDAASGRFFVAGMHHP